MLDKAVTEVDQLGKLLENINLKDITSHDTPDSRKKVTKLNSNNKIKEEHSGTPKDNGKDLYEYDLDNLVGLSKDSLGYKKEKNNNQESEEEIVEPEVLLKRGPQRSTRPLNVPAPYSHHGQYGLQYQGTVNTGRTSGSHLFSSSGKIITPEDCSNFLGSGRTCIVHRKKPSVLVSPPLIESSYAESTVHDLRDEFLLEDEFLTETLDLYLKPDEPFPDLGISDLFCESLDPNNITPEVSYSEFEHQIIEYEARVQRKIPEQEFSSQSTDVGYISDSTDCLSNANSPASSLPSKIPTFSSDLKITSSRRRASSNPYFSDLDRDYSDECCKDILKKANEVGGLNQRDKYNRTLLHLSIQQRNDVYSIVLLNMLHMSFQNGTGSKSLPTFPDLPSFLNHKDDFGHTPLLLACMYNLPKVLEYLLDCGASPALNEKFNFGSVLHYVCERGSEFQHIAEILCTKVSTCLNMHNSRKETPLHIAVRYHGIKYENGSSGSFGKVDNFALIRLLLEKNARLRAQDELGQTPVHWMIITKNFDLMNLLYSKSCDWKAAVNLQNVEGRTVLHGAAQYADIAVQKQKNLVHKLLACFASPLIADKQGKYPKDIIPEDRREDLSVLNACFCNSENFTVGFF